MALGSAIESAYSSGDLISEVIWQAAPVVWTTARLRGEWPGGLDLSVLAALALALPSGRVTDSDYLNGDDSLTHFSQHDGRLIGGQTVDNISLGWRLDLADGLALWDPSSPTPAPSTSTCSGS